MLLNTRTRVSTLYKRGPTLHCQGKCEITGRRFSGGNAALSPSDGACTHFLGCFGALARSMVRSFTLCAIRTAWAFSSISSCTVPPLASTSSKTSLMSCSRYPFGRGRANLVPLNIAPSSRVRVAAFAFNCDESPPPSRQIVANIRTVPLDRALFDNPSCPNILASPLRAPPPSPLARVYLRVKWMRGGT